MSGLKKEIITNRTELKHRIMQLNAKKVEQEAHLKRNFKEIMYKMQPAEFLKDSWNGITKDSGLKQDVKSMGLEAGATFLIGKLLGKNASLKGYVSSFLVQKLASLVIRKNPDVIFSGISKLGKLFKLT